MSEPDPPPKDEVDGAGAGAGAGVGAAAGAGATIVASVISLLSIQLNLRDRRVPHISLVFREMWDDNLMRM